MNPTTTDATTTDATTTGPDHDMNDLELDEMPRRRVPRWIPVTIGVLVGLVVVAFGAILLYAKVLNDSPDELDTNDLDQALAIDGAATTVAAPTATSAATVDTAPSTAGSAGASSPAAAALSTWQVTDASELGYRVKEVLFGVDTTAVGRTNQITGTMTIDGTALTEASFEVDVASIESDESRRDSQFRGRIMSTDEFPTATFTLTEPIELGTEPVDGASVETTATGDLTLRGVTNPVTFDVTARVENGQIGVLGSIPVVFADYGIANPSFSGITTEDNGLLEFVLVFEPAA